METIKKQPDDMKQNVILAPFCSFQIGGPADFFIKAHNKNQLKESYIWAKQNNVPVLVVGGGSNMVFSDAGFRGLVIRNEANKVEIEGNVVIAESGVLWSQIVKKAIDGGLSGVEKFIGIPGTLGGAVRGNAGCNGVETKDLLISAVMLGAKTLEEMEVEKKYFDFAYRESKIKHHPELVLSVKLQLQYFNGDSSEQWESIKASLADRNSKQPGGKNAGSFFKNPSLQMSAGKVIDDCGLKGFSVGDAQVSEKHGNFFVNLGKATQKDLVALGKKVASEVYEKTGIRLEQEVNIIDEYGGSIRI